MAKTLIFGGNPDKVTITQAVSHLYNPDSGQIEVKMSKSDVIDAHAKAEPCSECSGRGFHSKSCSLFVDLAREENKRAIREDIERDFDRGPNYGMDFEIFAELSN